MTFCELILEPLFSQSALIVFLRGTENANVDEMLQCGLRIIEIANSDSYNGEVVSSDEKSMPKYTNIPYVFYTIHFPNMARLQDFLADLESATGQGFL